jgi:hypothetical protein
MQITAEAEYTPLCTFLETILTMIWCGCRRLSCRQPLLLSSPLLVVPAPPAEQHGLARAPPLPPRLIVNAGTQPHTTTPV